MRSFALPWIPHDDVVLPTDIQGQPALGGAFDAADPLGHLHVDGVLRDLGRQVFGGGIAQHGDIGSNVAVAPVHYGYSTITFIVSLLKYIAFPGDSMHF